MFIFPDGLFNSYIFIKQLAGIFIWIVLNLQINLGRTDIFVILTYPFQEKEMSFHLFLKFSSCIFMHFFVKFVPKHLIFFYCENAFLHLYDLCLLFVYIKATEFCILILYPALSANSVTIWISSVIASLGFIFSGITLYDLQIDIYFFSSLLSLRS